MALTIRLRVETRFYAPSVHARILAHVTAGISALYIRCDRIAGPVRCLAESISVSSTPRIAVLRRSNMRIIALAVLTGLMLIVALVATGESPKEPPTGPFGLSRVTTVDGKPADIEDFFLNEDCALCHERQDREMAGSMHSIAHTDRFYAAFAELAREEAGEEVYALCSGCHTPAGVVSGLVPARRDPDLPAEAKAGVTCDVCHQITKTTGPSGPWGEPGNASFVLDPGRVKFGAADEIRRNPAHRGARRPFYETSEFCANCHTIIHPVNGLRIEHTYAEWKGSVYAEKGIQCQDCHMRSVEDARTVARTLEVVTRKGSWITKGRATRELAPHMFIGANSNAHLLGGGEAQSAMARERLKSAAAIEIVLPEKQTADSLAFDVIVKNIGAGHKLPTSLTEIREMWVDLTVTGRDGEVLHRSGALDEKGDIVKGAIRFGAVMEDAEGNVTVKPWEGVKFRSKRLVPPRGEDRTSIRIPSAAGPVVIEAKLLYRSASPRVVREIMKDDAFVPEIVEMCAARREIE
jgi:Cytochrome c554 and c-prime